MGGRVRRVELAGLAALTVLLRLPLVLARHPLSYDDGVYGASVVAMRAGARQYHDAFSGQGPLYFPLLRAGDLLGFQADWAPRVTGLLAAVLVTVLGATLVGRAAGRTEALVTGLLLATSGQLVATFGSIEADAVVVAVGLVAVSLALGGRGPLAVGLAIGAALSVKNLLAVPAVLAALVVLGWDRRLSRAGAALGVAAATCVALALPWGLATVWDASVEYHLEARDEAVGTAADSLYRLLSSRDRTAVIVLGIGLAGLVASDRRRRDAVLAEPGTRATLVAVTVWTVAAFVVVLAHRPLFSQHPTAVVVPLCLLAGLTRPWWPAALVAGALLVPGQLRVVGVRPGEAVVSATAATYLADLAAHVPDGARGIADDPGLLWWAGIETPPELIDTSFVRILTGRLDATMIEEAAAEPDVCVVLEVSGRFAVLAPLDLPGYEVAVDYGEGRRLLVKPACAGGG